VVTALAVEWREAHAWYVAAQVASVDETNVRLQAELVADAAESEVKIARQNNVHAVAWLAEARRRLEAAEQAPSWQLYTVPDAAGMPHAFHRRDAGHGTGASAEEEATRMRSPTALNSLAPALAPALAVRVMPDWLHEGFARAEERAAAATGRWSPPAAGRVAGDEVLKFSMFMIVGEHTSARNV
jgi:hypothetical protein